MPTPASYDVRSVDDDASAADNFTSTDLGFFGPGTTETTDLTPLQIYLRHLNQDESAVSGTGNFQPILRVNGDETLVGFNTDENISNSTQNTLNLDIDNSWTNEIQLGDIPIIYLDLNHDGVLEGYYQINLDINESNELDVSLEEFQIFTSAGPANLTDYRIDNGDTLAFRASDGYDLVFDLDATGDTELLLDDVGAGQGRDDYHFFIPVDMFDGALSSDYVTLFAQFGPTPPDDAGFAEFRVLEAAHIIGIKFEDINGNGVQDDGEDGLEGFLMYIDLDHDGIRDGNEPIAVSDATGMFTFDSLLPNTTYTIREDLSASPSGYLLTTGDAEGDHDVVITDADDYFVSVGNMPYNPELDVVKDVDTITGGVGTGGLDGADSAGDTINYTITVTNTGNVDLTGISVTDPNADAGSITRVADISGDDDNVLEIGEVWAYTATHTVTQDELDGEGIDAAGVIDGDGDVDNIATADSDQTGPDTDDAVAPLVYDPELDILKDVDTIDGGVGTDGLDGADSAGDTINYTISVANSGNVTLTNVSVTDPNADLGSITRIADITGDDDNLLEVGEVWAYTATHTVTQDELDGQGIDTDGVIDGDGDVDNIATADSDETGPDTDDAVALLVYDPELNIVKDVDTISGGVGTDGLDGADSAGDTINYTITLTNTGNISLTGISVTDPNADTASITRIADITGNDDNILDVGEVWAYTATHTVTQDELDGQGIDADGVIDGDGDVDNVATADSNETGPDTDDAVAPLVYDPSVDITKYVSVSPTTTPPTADDPSWDDANAGLGPNNVNIGDPVYFMVTLTNDGNVTLTNISITDVNTSNGGNTTITLYSTGTGLLAGVTLTGDDGNDFLLGVGETWTLIYTQPFDAGDHVNTAYVTTAEGATDDDAAHYYSLVNEGPGVRTPGFWSNWTDFWDGDSSVPKQAGQPCFPEQDLLYLVDGPDADADLDDKGLLIGDYNKNGITDGDEDTFYISYEDALSLINASNKGMQDGVIKIGRDMVATWLNYLAGNNIDPIDPADENSPRAYLDAAIDWMQTFGDLDNSNATGNTYDPSEDFDSYSSSHKAVKTGTGFWTQDFGGSGFSGDEMHGALDYYNNTGMTSPTSDIYAHDCDDPLFVQALTAYTTNHSFLDLV